MGRAVCGVCEDGGDAGVEPGDRAVGLGGPPDNFCVVVLVHDPCGVGLADLFYGRVAGARAHNRYTPERVVQDDGLDECVERGDVLDGGRQFAARTLHVGVLAEVCHCSSSFFSLSRGAC